MNRKATKFFLSVLLTYGDRRTVVIVGVHDYLPIELPESLTIKQKLIDNV